MASFSDLPEELEVDIMSWLPPESLLRFKCVKKSWYILINALIRNPTFVAKHLNNSIKKTSSLVLKCRKTNRYGDTQHKIISLYNDETNAEYLNHVTNDFKPHILVGQESFSVQSHCNGIICLFSDHDILLCNPATRENKLLLPDSSFSKDLFMTFRVGFGYDSINEVYKVVRVFGWFGDLRAEVCTLSSDISWREIKMEMESKDDYYFRPGSQEQVFCKGVYYWLVCKNYFEERSFNQIVHSFDMHDEEFHTIPLPDHFELSIYNMILTQWNESVALFYYPRAKFVMTRPIEMWIMHESSSEAYRNSCFNWTKHLSIAPLGGIYKTPMAFWKSDELLMREGQTDVVSYNLLTKKVRSLHRRDIMVWSHAFGYVNSLVQLT